MPSSVNVTIRMYKVGELGDCFFLRFQSGAKQSHVLIDCGSFRNSDKSIKRMNEIADDISAELKGSPLNVVAGTHQHNDHLSGFVHAEEKFKAMDIEQVWLSWLDNPNDQDAVKIGKEYNNYLANLRSISKNLGTIEGFDSNKTAKATKSSVDAILQFYGVNDSALGLNAKEKFPPDLPAEAVKVLKKLGSGKPKYLAPGQVFNLPGMASNTVKVYVLGPPKNEKLLKDASPNSKETYDHGLAVTNAQAEKMLLALKNLSPGNANLEEEQPYPFNEPYFESKNIDGLMDRYNKASDKWRTIDNDWLKQAERLALWLDSYTNNSSLVLAFELVKAEKVLLFVGDAQTGNWNSWKTIDWKGMPAGFNWISLLEKTVLYKVGHHCSHNATLVEGLEAMVHEELVAMIPVDVSDGNITKENGWKMPAQNLYARLIEKTHSRILRMDKGIVDKNKIASKKAWNKLAKPKDKTLYVEYEVRG